MGEWYTVRALRRERYVILNSGDSFNIETISDVKKWVNPQFFYTIIEWNGRYDKNLDNRVSIEGTYPNYRVVSKSSNSSFKIVLLVADGDGDSTINVSGTSGFMTKKLGYSKKIVTLNSSNNWSFDVSDMREKSNIITMYSFKTMQIPTGIYNYRFDTRKISESRYQCSLTGSYSNKLKKTVKNIALNTDIRIYTKSPFITITGMCDFQGHSSTTEVKLIADSLHVSTSVLPSALYKGEDTFINPYIIQRKHDDYIDVRIQIDNYVSLHGGTLVYTELDVNSSETINLLNSDTEIICLILGE